MPRMEPPGGHGTQTAYAYYQCRCDACRAANAAYARRWRASRHQRVAA